MADEVELYKDVAGEYRWRRRDADDGHIISVPGEGFRLRAHMERNAARANPDIPAEEWIDVTGDV